MSRTIVSIYKDALIDLWGNQSESALAGFCTAMKNDPRHIWSRYNAGRALLQMGQREHARSVFFALSEYCLRAGHPLCGITFARYAESGTLLELAARLYSAESTRVQASLQSPEIPLFDMEQTAQEVFTTDKDLVQTATELAKQFPTPSADENLPAIPLLSLFPENVLLALLQRVSFQTYRPGDMIIHEGDPSTTLYYLAHGKVEIINPNEKADKPFIGFGTGTLFGEKGLVSDTPRGASAIAVEESEVLQLEVTDLELAADECDYDDMESDIARFTQTRYLQRLLMASPVFAQISAGDRQRVLRRVKLVRFSANEIVVREGETGKGLFLLVIGSMEVAKFSGEALTHLSNLNTGSMFGEIALMRNVPISATVRATQNSECLFLSRDDFQELISEKPDVQAAMDKLCDERIAEQKIKLSQRSAPFPRGIFIF